MKIIIKNNSLDPIYLQIYEQIRDQIIDGSLETGELLPSIRALAKSLQVSVITVKRAYQELSNDGYIETTIGKGTFVKELNNDLFLELKRKEIEDYLLKAIEISQTIGVSYESLEESLKDLYYME